MNCRPPVSEAFPALACCPWRSQGALQGLGSRETGTWPTFRDTPARGHSSKASRRAAEARWEHGGQPPFRGTPLGASVQRGEDGRNRKGSPSALIHKEAEEGIAGATEQAEGPCHRSHPRATWRRGPSTLTGVSGRQGPRFECCCPSITYPSNQQPQEAFPMGPNPTGLLQGQ